ncbi:hypothetical protein Angca_000732 [Angiostrongylus cantonensis]|nr:hypothetical protein Angca_000732 [Angiostrongylus cantonensis]
MKKMRKGMSTISDRTSGNSPNISTTSLQPKPERFNCSILMVSSVGVVQLVVQWIAVNVSSFIAQGLILFVVAYSYEWNSVHSESLTRHRRAHFDIANVLETYQPRNRTMGHLFQPEPPTPGNVAITETSNEEVGKKSEFTNHRDAHYANMYTHAIQQNKEMDMVNKSVSASLDGAPTENVVLTPADPVRDQKEYEEKRKRYAEEYQKQFDKPFSC